MHIAPELAAYLVSDPGAWASFVADLDRRNMVVHSMRVISLSSPVPGVPVMVLRVIPAEHGKAKADVNAAIEETVRILNASGLSVRWVCSDGDSTYVQKLAASLSVLRDMLSYDFRLPAHRQTRLLPRVFIP
jgi:hypothetical protein